MELLKKGTSKIIVAAVVTVLLVLAGLTGAQSNLLFNQGFIEGYFKNVTEENTLVIEAYDGNVYYLPIDAGALFSIDEVQVTISAFKPGMEVRATLANDKGVTYITGYSTANRGYLAPGSKMRSGIVVNIENGRIWLRLETGEVRSYLPSSYTLVMKNGRRVNLGSVYEGDRVKLFFDNYHTAEISRLEIQGNSTEIKEVYKGRLVVARNFGSSLVLENVQVLKNGTWQNHQAVMSVPYPGDDRIFVGGRQLPRQQLGFFQGNEVYVMTKEIFGREQAEKVIIKQQFESAYVDKIESVNMYTGALQLVRNDKLTLHNDTVIINNRRIVERHSLSASADAFIVANGQGNDKLASLIYIFNQDINNSVLGRNQYYSGKLNIITENTVWLDHIDILVNNGWQYQFDLEKQLYYDNDTYIIDLMTSEEVKAEDLPFKGYAVDESSQYALQSNLKSWYGYMYTNGERIVAMAVMPYPQSLSQQRATGGLIKSIDYSQDTGWRVTLQDVTEWSNVREQWLTRTDQLTINLTGAMLLADDYIIKPQDLKVGDSLYLVRDNNMAKLLLVK